MTLHSDPPPAAEPGEERAQHQTTDLPVWQADMADFDPPHRYGVIVCAVSTLFMLPDQEGQIGYLRCAAHHLQT